MLLQCILCVNHKQNIPAVEYSIQYIEVAIECRWCLAKGLCRQAKCCSGTVGRIDFFCSARA